MSVRIGVDVGGTFTDFVCFDEAKGELKLLKVPSTPREPHRAVIEGTARLIKEYQIPVGAINFFIHGTTVGTNAILERKGARVALLVTEGFRDVLYIMRQDRPSLYDFFLQRPEPLVPRNLRLEIPERLLHTGEVLIPMQEEPARQALRILAAAGIRDIAVCLLHSYANSDHEQQLRRWILEEIPEAHVSLSSEVLPEFKEFERMNTTVVNAYVQPLLGQYLSNLETGLASLSVPSGLHIMQSNGGIMTARTAQTHSVHTVLSGPAAGAVSGLILGRQVGVDNIISLDVGGTSADVAVAYEGHLHYADETEIGGQVIKVPAIQIHTVGAGGGSIGWIDPGGALQVGPQSAGADPGPACYARGGTEPTVTDANLVLGRLNPEYFLGGQMAIDVECARKAIQQKIAGPLGLKLEEAAEGIIRVINAVMAKAIRRLSVEKGYDPREFTLVSFGGAGPLHATMLAAELQIPRVLVPLAPGVSSSLGLLTADFRHDFVRTVLWKMPQMRVGQLGELCAQLEAQALERMTREHVDARDVIVTASADLRYQGQGFSLETRFTLEELKGWSDLEALASRFHQLHQAAYGYSDERETIEIVNVRLTATGRLPQPQFESYNKERADASAAVKGSRQAYLEGKFYNVPVYDRAKLSRGIQVNGPAIVEQLDSTTLIFPNQRAVVEEFGNLMIWLEDVA